MNYLSNNNIFELTNSEGEKFRLKVEQDRDAESPREWENLGAMICWHKRYRLGDKHTYKNPEEFLQSLAYNYAPKNINVDKLSKAECNELINNQLIMLPLYLYDHSGITMNTSGFSCPWDSGQVGYIYAPKKKFLEETGYTEKELFSNDKHRVPDVGERVKLEGFADWGQVVSIDNDCLTVDFDYCKSPPYKKEENIVTASILAVTEVMTNRAKEMLKGEVDVYDQFLQGDVYGYILEKPVVCECCGNVEYEEIDSCWGFYGTTLEQCGILEQISSELKLV